MYKAIFYKEWIKTRMSVLLVIALMAGGIIYAFINMAQEFRVSGAVQVWNAVIVKDPPLLPVFVQWLPALTGLILALSQFVPEMTDKRLKLTLHLPVAGSRIITLLLVYGVVVLAGLYVVSYIVLVAGAGAWYPAEMVSGMCLKSLPWFLGGICAYLCTAWVCLEPVWRYRITYAVAAACMGSFFYINAVSGAYLPMLPYLAVFTAVCFAFPFLSVARFEEGAQ